MADKNRTDVLEFLDDLEAELTTMHVTGARATAGDPEAVELVQKRPGVLIERVQQLRAQLGADTPGDGDEKPAAKPRAKAKN